MDDALRWSQTGHDPEFDEDHGAVAEGAFYLGPPLLEASRELPRPTPTR